MRLQTTSTVTERERFTRAARSEYTSGTPVSNDTLRAVRGYRRELYRTSFEPHDLAVVALVLET